MKIQVFDVPAEIGGVLTILKGLNEYAFKSDEDIEWNFVVSTDSLKSSSRVTVSQYAWAKKSWFHRMFFDLFFAPVLAKKYSPNVIFSLSNLKIPFCRKPQAVYFQQGLFLTRHKYKFSESKIYWAYQNILRPFVFRSLRASEAIIVQTEWMKNDAAEIAGADKEKISIITPELPKSADYTYLDRPDCRRQFFYPVNYMPFKHHDTIIAAAQKLRSLGFDDFEIAFTGNSDAVRSSADSVEANIRFMGTMQHEKVMKYYASSVLLFASELESYGLPLLEARLTKSIIIVADTPFAHEILSVYPNAHYFPVGDSNALCELMRSCIEGSMKYETEFEPFSTIHPMGWAPVTDVLRSIAE